MLTSSIFCALTLLIYIAAQWLYRRLQINVLNPVIVTIAVVTTGLVVADIPYAEYQRGGRIIDWWLEPSIVALGYPLFLQLQDIKSDLVALLTACLFASIIGIISILFFCAAFGLSEQALISLTPKAVTTAIAVVISDQQGGITALTAVTVIYVGLLGSVIALPVMRLGRITSAKARGIAMGAASHALGTARIRQEGPTEGAYSALALVFCAIFTALLTPVLLRPALTLLGY